MTDNKAFLIINAIVNKENMAEVQAYLGNVMPVFGKNGGRPVARLKTVEQLVGSDGPEMVGILEFPSADAIKKMVESDDFTALAESRAKAFQKLDMLICEEM